jgi:hypothetical protein
LWQVAADHRRGDREPVGVLRAREALRRREIGVAVLRGHHTYLPLVIRPLIRRYANATFGGRR